MSSRLKSISGSNFRSFRAPFSVDLPESGLVLLQGLNHDTGGSSGSGKSSLALAINYALGSCSIPATELASWDGDTAQVKLELTDRNGLPLEISRGKKLDIKVSNTSMTGSAGQKEEGLAKALGLSAEMLQALTYRPQRKPGLFLSKTDSEKKEFLTQLLGLDTFEKAQETGAAKIKELETQLSSAEGALAVLQQQVNELGEPEDLTFWEQEAETLAGQLTWQKTLIEELQARQTEHQAKVTADAKAASDAFGARIREITAKIYSSTPGAPVIAEDHFDTTELERLTDLISQCDSRIKRLSDEDAAKKRVVDAEAAEQQKEIVSANRLGAGLNGFLAEQKRLCAELAKLESSICPTCEREWLESEALKFDITRKLEDLASSINEAHWALGCIPDMEVKLQGIKASFAPNPKIQQLVEMKSTVSSQYATEKQRLNGMAAQATAEANAVLAGLKAEMSSLQLQANQAAAAVVAAGEAVGNKLSVDIVQAQQAVRGHDASFRDAQQNIVRIQEAAKRRQALGLRLITAIATTGELEASVNRERDFLHVIGREGFLGSIFQECLDEISDETNRLLGSIANVRGVTIRFASESLTQKGTTKRSIVPVVTINGNEAPLYSGLSGGMLSSVELGVDLALGAVISRRTGVCPSWLVLDECFGGLDDTSAESCFEMLKVYSRDRLILVVDHAAQFKSLFDHFITIEYRSGESVVR